MGTPYKTTFVGNDRFSPKIIPFWLSMISLFNELKFVLQSALINMIYLMRFPAIVCRLPAADHNDSRASYSRRADLPQLLLSITSIPACASMTRQEAGK